MTKNRLILVKGNKSKCRGKVSGVSFSQKSDVEKKLN
jgi:hypothetical protein